MMRFLQNVQYVGGCLTRNCGYAMIIVQKEVKHRENAQKLVQKPSSKQDGVECIKKTGWEGE